MVFFIANSPKVVFEVSREASEKSLSCCLYPIHGSAVFLEDMGPYRATSLAGRGMSGDGIGQPPISIAPALAGVVVWRPMKKTFARAVALLINGKGR